MDAMPMFEVGGTYPRAGDDARMDRYREADILFRGDHKELQAARRIREKLEAQYGVNASTANHTIESVVWMTFNLPRLIVQKFADLQVLNTPILMADEELESDEDLIDEVGREMPDLWDQLHWAKQVQRAYGDVVILPVRPVDDGPIELRVVSPLNWFPVLDPVDELRVTAHQIAWVEVIKIGRREEDVLRVDVMTPDTIERRAFLLEGQKAEGASGRRRLLKEIDLATYFPGLAEREQLDLGGEIPCVHIPNGRLRPGTIFGRPEFLDSMSLIDNANWRLSTWSDANDRVSHAPEILTPLWLAQDEDGTVLESPRFRRRFLAQNNRTADAMAPMFMEYPLAFETLVEEWQKTVLAICWRHEMAPALLGIELSAARESGEAKQLGMGTTEAATRRDLQASEGRINRLLTMIARLKGRAAGRLTAHWRVGLPKSQGELMDEIAQKLTLGLITRRKALKMLYPWLSEESLDQLVNDLDEEAAERVRQAMPDLQAEVG